MQPNTFQGENGGDGHADPTSETPLAMATSIHDMFMFSDDSGDAFRPFWGMPKSQAQASFHQLRAAGGLLISGSQAKGVTAWIALLSVAGATNATMFAPPDWSKAAIAASVPSVQISKCAGSRQCWVLDGLKPDEPVILYPRGKVPTAEQLTLKPADGNPKDFNWWGMHDGGAGRD